MYCSQHSRKISKFLMCQGVRATTWRMNYRSTWSWRTKWLAVFRGFLLFGRNCQRCDNIVRRAVNCLLHSSLSVITDHWLWVTSVAMFLEVPEFLLNRVCTFRRSRKWKHTAYSIACLIDRSECTEKWRHDVPIRMLSVCYCRTGVLYPLLIKYTDYRHSVVHTNMC